MMQILLLSHVHGENLFSGGSIQPHFSRGKDLAGGYTISESVGATRGALLLPVPIFTVFSAIGRPVLRYIIYLTNILFLDRPPQ